MSVRLTSLTALTGALAFLTHKLQWTARIALKGTRISVLQSRRGAFASYPEGRDLESPSFWLFFNHQAGLPLLTQP